jgi:hypothetical protein
MLIFMRCRRAITPCCFRRLPPLSRLIFRHFAAADFFRFFADYFRRCHFQLRDAAIYAATPPLPLFFTLIFSPIFAARERCCATGAMPMRVRRRKDARRWLLPPCHCQRFSPLRYDVSLIFSPRCFRHDIIDGFSLFSLPIFSLRLPLPDD